MEDELAVRLAAHVAVEEGGELLGEAAAQPGEGVDRAGVGEEPLAVAEGVRVLGAGGPDRGEPDVGEQGVGPDVVG